MGRTDHPGLVVGEHADFGVLSGGGSSQVTPANGAPRIVELGGDGPLAAFARRLYMRSSPLAASRRFRSRQGSTGRRSTAHSVPTPTAVGR